MELADAAIRDIVSRGLLPIVAGGTGLYQRALLHGIVEAPPRDERLRAGMLDEEERDPGVLRRRLEEVDPAAAAQIPAADLVRTVRALEVHVLTGRPITEFQDAHGFQPVRYRALQVAPDWPREELYARIDERVDRMMDAGWLAEVRRLRDEGHGGARAFESVGYRQLADHLDGRRTLEEAVESIKTEHRRYARRQLVWFRAVEEVRWLPAPVDIDELMDLVRTYLKFQPTRPKKM
jgi:tRNA dimethylallyltransferase